MANIQYLKEQIRLLEKQIEAELNKEKKAQLQAQKQALNRTKNQSRSSSKRKTYTYKTEAAHQAAIQRGKALQMKLSPERKAEIEEARKKGLSTYQLAQKMAKESAEYKVYWDEIKKLRAQAKKLGVNLNLSNVSTSPTQIKDSRRGAVSEARIALGLATRIDTDQIMLKAEGDGVIEPILDNDKQVIGYTYNGKGYSVEDMKLMMSAPKRFFPAGSPFWNWVSENYYSHGGGKEAEEATAQEIFGS